jgi:hypothetical protein
VEEQGTPNVDPECPLLPYIQESSFMFLDIKLLPHTMVTAMPRVIDPITKDHSFVSSLKERIELALRGGREPISKVMVGSRPLNQIKFGANSGAYFSLTTDSEVGFLYYYKALRTSTRLRFQPAEALAFRFSRGQGQHGFVGPVFWDLILPEFKLVLSDAQYTDRGKDWWYAQYDQAASQPSKYGILVADVKLGLWGFLNPKDFNEDAEAYWGSESTYERFRFGIYLKQFEKDIQDNLLSRTDPYDKTSLLKL